MWLDKIFGFLNRFGIAFENFFKQDLAALLGLIFILAMTALILLVINKPQKK